MWNNNINFKIMSKENLLFGIGGLIVGGIITKIFLKKKESNAKTVELGATYLLAKYGSVWRKKNDSGNIFSVKKWPYWRGPGDMIEVRRGINNNDSNRSFSSPVSFIRLEDLLREYEPIK